MRNQILVERYLQDLLHADLLRDHAQEFVELQGAGVEGPDVKGDVVEAFGLGVFLDVLIDGAAYAFAPEGFIHADVVYVEGTHVREDRVAHDLLVDAETVAGDGSVFCDADEDRGGIVPDDLLQLGCVVLGGRAFEKVRAAVVVDHADLDQKLQYPWNISGRSSSYGIHFISP